MQNNNLCKEIGRRVHRKTVVSFVSVFLLCSMLINFNIVKKMDVEQLQMEQLILEHAFRIDSVVSKQLYKTQALAALVIQGDGTVSNFQRAAAVIASDIPALANMLLAPGGIVTNAYPAEGTQAVIGLNYFDENDHVGNREAIFARDSGELVMAGPFILRQGVKGLVGRYPVFIDTETEQGKFWGLVSVSLKFPEILDETGISTLEYQGFLYELWRINPDTDERQIIASNRTEDNSSARYIEKHLKIQNADWYFRIFPVWKWHQHLDIWIMIFLSLCVSVLVARVMQNNSELKIMKSSLEVLSHTDSLTGIHNRRHFMKSAIAQIEKIKRTSSSAFIILFDLDHFKKINDRYGHAVGDDVLKGVVSRVKNILRPYDLFARYGGEEFIIFVTNIDKQNAQNLAERIRLNIAEKPIICNDAHISITASFGISNLLLNYNIDKSVEYADKALYIAKKEGRNKVVFYDLDDIAE